VWGRRRCGEVVDAVDLEVEGIGNVVEDELEVGVPDPVLHIFSCPGVEVVEHGDLVPLPHQRVHEVRAHEPRAPRHQDSQPLPVWQLCCCLERVPSRNLQGLYLPNATSERGGEGGQRHWRGCISLLLG
jgi:hypothetical protein